MSDARVTPLHLLRPATGGDGIEQWSPTDVQRMAEAGDAAAASGRLMKVVPALESATRMFKDLIGASQAGGRPSANPAVRAFLARLDEFPFAADLRRRSGVTGAPSTRADEERLLHTLLADMRFGDLPLAAIPFHHGPTPRTPVEEHLLEAARYVRDDSGTCRVHFVVSAGARAKVEALLAQVTPSVQTFRRGARLSVTLSEHPWADAAVARGSHSAALLHALQTCGGDLVVIRPINNVLPDEANAEVVRWTRALIGCLTRVEAELLRHLQALDAASCSDQAVAEAEAFARGRFSHVPGEGSAEVRRLAVRSALDRPLRVCAVVRGDAGVSCAPMWVRDRDGRARLQMVEAAQVDMASAEQARVYRGAAHHHPGHMVCRLRPREGSAYPLTDYADPEAAHLSRMWSGGMAGWNTVCVEVPATTQAPVKTVFDLLRPQHRTGRAAPDVRPAIRVAGTVLVIDDQILNQRLLRQILERGGLQVVVAGDGERGLEMAHESAPDLILLDIVLPGLDGYELLAQLLSDPRTADIPVMLISALGESADKIRGMELGAVDYITKPFDPQEVLARVRAQLRIRALTSSLSAANSRLTEREQALIEDLKAAADVQRHLLPPVGITTPHLRSASVFEPSIAIGGDIYGVIPLADGSVLTFVADVSGHGVASALLTMSLAQWLASVERILPDVAAVRPSLVLEALERDYPFERFDRYFSIVIACIPADGSRVRYSAAGHPPPLVVRRTGEVISLEEGGPIIGMGFGLPFDDGECGLEVGDRLVLFTDGVVEDLDAAGQRFGHEALARAFVDARDLPLTEACSGLAATLRTRRGDAPAADDIALLAFERT